MRKNAESADAEGRDELANAKYRNPRNPYVPNETAKMTFIDVLEDYLNIVASGIGSLTNPTKLSCAFIITQIWEV